MNSFRVQFKFALMAMVFIMAFGYSDIIPPSNQKKIDKEIKKIWPDERIIVSDFHLEQGSKVKAQKIGIDKIVSLFNNDELVGYLVYMHVPSKFDTFDLGIFYTEDLHIRSFKLLAYREDHGGEVGSKRWLKQFIGLGEEDPITLNNDIQGISGATISCESATKGAKEVTEFLNQIILVNQ